MPSNKRFKFKFYEKSIWIKKYEFESCLYKKSKNDLNLNLMRNQSNKESKFESYLYKISKNNLPLNFTKRQSSKESKFEFTYTKN